MLSLIGLLVAVYERRQVSFTIPNSGTTLTLKFGSLFDEPTDWIVAVNEYFDSELGDIVATSSLHGKVITEVYRGNSENFRNDVDKALSGIQGVTDTRVKGHPVRYPLGTVAIIQNGPTKIYLVALTKTDIDTHRASSTVPVLWNALGNALAAVDRVGNGDPVAMPLIGNGRASLNIAPQHLLRLIALKIVDAKRSHDLPHKMTINLSDECFELLDIIEIKRGWSVI
ncbi:macro domain-containing protein [Sphingomonas aurantiaca]|uniref:macro domain-containing protein n=1 Tax=Sphingomonas aurantiaca TaxID=185949 RepID=UPI00125FE05B|nr:macro domain-containing protein [Sphingomonas aurantiaca]